MFIVFLLITNKLYVPIGSRVNYVNKVQLPQVFTTVQQAGKNCKSMVEEFLELTGKLPINMTTLEKDIAIIKSERRAERSIRFNEVCEKLGSEFRNYKIELQDKEYKRLVKIVANGGAK